MAGFSKYGDEPVGCGPMELVSCKKRAKVRRSIGSFSVQKHANLTVQSQHVNGVFIQIYIRICTHCCTVSLI
jgi:hypothetical protein